MPLLPNRDDVESRSALRGFSGMLCYTGHPKIQSVTSGGGSVGYDFYGASLQSGATAGDTAGLEGYYASRIKAPQKITTEILYHASYGGDPPHSGDMEIGWLGATVNSNGGAYVDLADGMYHAGDQTAPATLPSQNANVFLRITIDFGADETTFTQAGAVNETVTLPAAKNPTNGIARVASAGTNIGIYVEYIKQQIGGVDY